MPLRTLARCGFAAAITVLPILETERPDETEGRLALRVLAEWLSGNELVVPALLEIAPRLQRRQDPIPDPASPGQSLVRGALAVQAIRASLFALSIRIADSSFGRNPLDAVLATACMASYVHRAPARMPTNRAFDALRLAGAMDPAVSPPASHHFLGRWILHCREVIPVRDASHATITWRRPGLPCHPLGQRTTEDQQLARVMSRYTSQRTV